jgi:hypothetical protein
MSLTLAANKTLLDNKVLHLDLSLPLGAKPDVNNCKDSNQELLAVHYGRESSRVSDDTGLSFRVVRDDDGGLRYKFAVAELFTETLDEGFEAPEVQLLAVVAGPKMLNPFVNRDS